MDGRGLIQVIERMLKPLHVRLRNVVTRGTVESDLGPTGNFAGRSIGRLKVEGLAGKLKEPVEHFQPVGYLCVPAEGAEAILANLQGDSTMPIAIAVSDRRHIPRQGPGAAADFGPMEPVLFVLDGAVVAHGRAGGHMFLGGADESAEGAPENLAALAALVKAELDSVRADVEDELNAIRDGFDLHTHLCAAPGAASGTAGASAPATVLGGVNASDLGTAGEVACERTHVG